MNKSRQCYAVIIRKDFAYKVVYGIFFCFIKVESAVVTGNGSERSRHLLVVFDCTSLSGVKKFSFRFRYRKITGKKQN